MGLLQDLGASVEVGNYLQCLFEDSRRLTCFYKAVLPQRLLKKGSRLDSQAEACICQSRGNAEFFRLPEEAIAFYAAITLLVVRLGLYRGP